MKFLKTSVIILSVAAIFLFARSIRILEAAGNAKPLLWCAGGCIMLAAFMLCAVFIIYTSEKIFEQRLQKEIDELYVYRPKKKKNTSAIFIALAAVLLLLGGILGFGARKRLDALKLGEPLLDRKQCGEITADVKYQQDGTPYYTFVDGVTEYKAVISDDDKDMIKDNKIRIRYLYDKPDRSAPDNLFHIADDMQWRALVLTAAAALFMAPVLFIASLAIFVLDRR